MKALVFLMALALSFPVAAQKLGSEAPASKADPKKKKTTKTDKGNPKAKMGSQDWGRFTDNGNKSLTEQEQKKQAAKAAAAKK